MRVFGGADPQYPQVIDAVGVTRFTLSKTEDGAVLLSLQEGDKISFISIRAMEDSGENYCVVRVFPEEGTC